MYEQERNSLKVIQRQLAETDIDQITDLELMEIVRLIDCQMNGYCQQLVFKANEVINNFFNDNTAIDMFSLN